MRLAILDDYQNYGPTAVAWEAIEGLDVVSFGDHVYTETDLIHRLQGFDAVLRIRERTEFSAEVLAALPQLRLVLCTGMRNARSIDLAACDRLGITVCATDALHQTTVELTVWLMIALMRGLPRECASLRAGGWQVGVGRALGGKTLGVVGLGNMGIPVSKICKIMGMDVIAWSPNLTQERASEHGVRAVSKEELFAQADVVTLHMPHINATEHLVSAAELALMKPTAFIVNTARPKLIDQEALLDALQAGRIAGLGADVFDIEPLPRDHPFRLLPNVLATPHIGFVVEENYRIFYETSFENLKAYLAGKPQNRITGERPFLPDSQVAKQMHSSKLSVA